MINFILIISTIVIIVFLYKNIQMTAFNNIIDNRMNELFRVNDLIIKEAAEGMTHSLQFVDVIKTYQNLKFMNFTLSKKKLKDLIVYEYEEFKL